ncbi:BTB/POZ protein [Baffinella frigidus]|nr:BTB/POZ protein [Cryptophyta sp. CCMP2293]
MSPPAVRFDVGGTVFKVAVSTIQSQPEGVLAKMIDGRFPCGKDESGAYFIDRSPRFFEIVLDVHRDNKVYPLAPGFTRERVVAELEFYGLQDFIEGGAPIDLSGESTVRSLLDAKRSLQDASGDFAKWKEEQKRLGNIMMNEALARLCIASAEIVREESPETLRISPLKVDTLPQVVGGAVYPYTNCNVSTQIVKLFEEVNTEATVTRGRGDDTSVKLEPAEPNH